jgi:hypothetical protein
MNNTIFKFPLPITEDFHCLRLSPGAQVVHAGEQHGKLCLWVEVDADATNYESRTFALVGTGRLIPKNAKHHRGTVIMPGGNLVIHVYETGPEVSV